MLLLLILKTALLSIIKFEGHLFIKQSKYHHFCMRFCIFCFSIAIFFCKNKCIVHVSLRRYPSISPSKAEDKYSWSCMFVIFSTLTCSDVPWLITFSLLKILKFLARLGLEISFSKDWQPYESFQNFRKKIYFTNLQKCFRKRYDHKVRGFYQNVNEFDLRLRFRSYHKERPKVQICTLRNR